MPELRLEDVIAQALGEYLNPLKVGVQHGSTNVITGKSAKIAVEALRVALAENPNLVSELGFEWDGSAVTWVKTLDGLDTERRTYPIYRPGNAFAQPPAFPVPQETP